MFLLDLIRLAFKVVITSTAIYWTNQLEVWSTLSSKGRAYDQVIACSKAYICKNTPESLKLQVSVHNQNDGFKNVLWILNVYFR